MALPPITVYVVDDDASVRSALARLMRSVGYVPEVFGSIDDLMSSRLSSSPACVIADVHMPNGNGLELQHRLRANGLSMPVILLTADDTAEVRALAKSQGYAGYFRKPVDDQALVDAIEWALDRAA